MEWKTELMTKETERMREEIFVSLCKQREEEGSAEMKMRERGNREERDGRRRKRERRMMS